MRERRKAAVARAFALTTAAVLLVGCGQLYALPQTSHKPAVGPFTPFPVSESTFAPTEAPRATVTPTLAAMTSPSATSRPRPPQPAKAKSEPIAPRTSHSITGKASWYCKAGVSICHHDYPPGSMVAAACGKLRAAMGPDWRGKTVTVAGGSGKVSVRLVDWCGSKTKLIDVYWVAMHKLGGTGVLSVTVSW